MIRIAPLTLMLAVAACSSTGPTASLSPSSSSDVGQWHEPTAYSFTLDSSCGERDLLGVFRVEVQSGMVVSVEGLDEAGRRYVTSRSSDGRIVGGVPTLAGLLDEARGARADGADVVLVSYDPTDGYPVSIDIDWAAEAIDDEACYSISDFVGPTG